MFFDHHSDEVAMNFSWLENESVAGCRGPRTRADLKFLASVGINVLVRLAYSAETGMNASDVESHGMVDLYEPIKDRAAPSQEQIERVLNFVNRAGQERKKVAVSCNAGCGRTGTVLACYLLLKGLNPEQAIQALIAARPCSAEVLRTSGQKQAVYDFYNRLQQGKVPGRW